MKSILVLFAFVLTTTFVQAQTAQTPVSPTERAHTSALRLQKQLGLTAEQTASAEAVILARNAEMDAVKADVNKTQEQKDSELAVIRANKEKDIQALLTPDQLIRYNEMKAARAARKKATAEDE